MDLLTHMLVGAVLVQAFFARRLGRLAPLVGALAAALADTDRLILLRGDGSVQAILANWSMLDQFTHALLLIPLWGALAALPFYWLKQLRYRRKSLIIASIAAAATHPLLDVLASQGTAIFWPFWQQRLAMDWVSHFDPLLALILLASMIAGLVRLTPIPGRAGCVALLFFLGLGAAQHERAMDVQMQLAEARTHIYERGRVIPAYGNLLVWRSIYKHSLFIQTDALRIAPGTEPTHRQGSRLRIYVPPKPNTTQSDSLQATQITRMASLADNWLGKPMRQFPDTTHTTDDTDTTTETYYDLRFASLPEEGLSAAAIQIHLDAPAVQPATWASRPPPPASQWRHHLSDALSGQSDDRPFTPLPPPLLSP